MRRVRPEPQADTDDHRPFSMRPMRARVTLIWGSRLWSSVGGVKPLILLEPDHGQKQLSVVLPVVLGGVGLMSAPTECCRANPFSGASSRAIRALR